MSLATLAEGLASLPHAIDPPETGRRGAVLVLLEQTHEGDIAITYTRRQPHLSSHPGQISFPGGRVDPGETIEAAAVREAAEEVGLDPASVEVLGRLPAFYIPPSRFWMVAVLAHWHKPHDLVANEAEVAELLTIPIATLREQERWRAVPLSAAGSTWAWHLAPGKLLWGATAVVTAVLLDIMYPRWSEGLSPSDLPEDRHVRPWDDATLVGQGEISLPRARLQDTPSRAVDAAGATPAEQIGQAGLQALGEGVAQAVLRLHRRPPGPVVVLVGGGTAGSAGRAAAERLAAAGADVQLFDVGAGEVPPDEAITGAGVIVDALVGRGLQGHLRDPALHVVRSLAATSAAIVAVDLPSGIHPDTGMAGEALSADVTVTTGSLVPGHVALGTSAFVADLYVVDDDGQLFRAEPSERPAPWAE